MGRTSALRWNPRVSTDQGAAGQSGWTRRTSLLSPSHESGRVGGYIHREHPHPSTGLDLRAVATNLFMFLDIRHLVATSPRRFSTLVLKLWGAVIEHVLRSATTPAPVGDPIQGYFRVPSAFFQCVGLCLVVSQKESAHVQIGRPGEESSYGSALMGTLTACRDCVTVVVDPNEMNMHVARHSNEGAAYSLHLRRTTRL